MRPSVLALSISLALVAGGCRSGDRAVTDCAGKSMGDPADGRSATLNWDRPAFREDGAPLEDLVGYKIYYGRQPGELRQTVEICAPTATTWVIGNLEPGTWYFAVTAVDLLNNESKPTAVVSKKID